MRYRKYDPMVMKMIIDTGNINLFPELKIPRTTAKYWIEKSKSPIVVNISNVNEAETKNLKKELYQCKAQILFLKRLLQVTSEKSALHALSSVEKKKKIVEIVEDMKGLMPVSEALKLLSITASTYYRYQVEVMGCKRKQQMCQIRRPNQVTDDEQRTMIRLATDRRFAHYSVKSLMYHAQREGVLFCGIDSWRKYLKLNQIVREKRNHRRPKPFKCGIRAQRPHELWHVDITELKTVKGERFYLQMIVDNYSRAILAWKIAPWKKLHLTLQTLKHAWKIHETLPQYLLSDGGGENNNKTVSRMLLGRGICQLIAKCDVFFSNSMIEAVFRQIKSREEHHQLENSVQMKKFIQKVVLQHNEIIPHSSLYGARPIEMLNQTWDVVSFSKHVKEARTLLLQQRHLRYQQCMSCLL